MLIVKLLSVIISALWYIVTGLFLMLGAPIIVIMQIASVITLMTTGYSSSFVGIAGPFILAFFIGITMLVPLFRKEFYRLPWFYPFCMVLLMDSVFLGAAEEVLYNGYASIGKVSHQVYIIIAIIVLLIGRVVISLIEWKKTFRIAGGDFYA
jgi:hypothetical protein